MWILGFDLNLIWFILGFFTVFMTVFNGLIDLFEEQLPLFVLEAFRYGKTLNGPVQSKIVSLISVPKSWFLHFYIFSSIYIPAVLYLAYRTYVQLEPLPPVVHQSLDFLCTKDRMPGTTPEAVLLVLVLLTVQSFRRLYECAFVNNQSTSTMNVLHYIVGYAHYFCASTGCLCEAPVFAIGVSPPLDLMKVVTPLNAAAVLLFATAWVHQYRVHVIFSECKKKNPLKHSVPSGDWFGLVSCPHYLAEVLIYSAIAMVAGPGHSTMVLLLVWVLTNQVVAALMSHKWYLRTFKDYSKQRTVIFPYVL